MDNKKLIGGIVVAIILVAGAFMITNNNEETTTTEKLDGNYDYNEEYEIHTVSLISIDGSETYIKVRYMDEYEGMKTIAEYDTDNGHENEGVFIKIRYDEDLPENSYKFIHEDAWYDNDNLIKDDWILTIGNEEEYFKFIDTLNKEEGFEYFEFVENEGGFSFYTHMFFATLDSDEHTLTGNYFELGANEEGVFQAIN